MTDNKHTDHGNRRVTDVEYLHDYTMLLVFNKGGKRIVDFEPLMRGKHFFEELLDPHGTEPYNADDDDPMPSAAEPARV